MPKPKVKRIQWEEDTKLAQPREEVQTQVPSLPIVPSHKKPAENSKPPATLMDPPVHPAPAGLNESSTDSGNATEIPLQTALIDQLTREIRALVHEAGVLGFVEDPGKISSPKKKILKQPAKKKTHVKPKSPTVVATKAPNTIPASQTGIVTTTTVTATNVSPSTTQIAKKAATKGKTKPTTPEKGKRGVTKTKVLLSPRFAPGARATTTTEELHSIATLSVSKVPSRHQQKPVIVTTIAGKSSTSTSASNTKNETTVAKPMKSKTKLSTRKSNRPSTAPEPGKSGPMRQTMTASNNLMPSNFPPDKAYWVQMALDKLGKEWVGSGTVPSFMLNTMEFQTAIGSLYDLALKKKRSKISSLIKDAAMIAEKTLSQTKLESNGSAQEIAPEPTEEQRESAGTSILSSLLHARPQVPTEVQRQMSTVLFKLMMDRNQSPQAFAKLKNVKKESSFSLVNNNMTNTGSRPGSSEAGSSNVSSRPSIAGSLTSTSAHKGALRHRRASSSNAKSKNVAFMNSVSNMVTTLAEKKTKLRKSTSKGIVRPESIRNESNSSLDDVPEVPEESLLAITSDSNEKIEESLPPMTDKMHYSYVFDGRIFVSTPKVAKTFVNSFAPISISRRLVSAPNIYI